MIFLTKKIAKNQFRCFHCRLVFTQQDGDWCDWDAMQVHLCRSCNKLTERRPERAYVIVGQSYG